MNTAIQIKNASVIWENGTKALDGVSITIPKGKKIGLIGPSGAGKTSLIRLIVGDLNISSGSIDVLDLPAGSKELRKKISYMSQELSVYTDLTVEENLTYFITMMGVLKNNIEIMLTEILDQVDLSSKRKSLVSSLSGGQKQRVSLAIALIGNPEILVLDEPTVGLDPVLRESLWNLFNTLASNGTTLVISSHSMDEASRCDDLILIRDGKILAHEAPDTVLQTTKSKTVEEAFLKLVEHK